MADKQFMKNRYGIPIAVCCASCAHNLGADSEKTRICEFGTTERPSYQCNNWGMRRSLDNAGKGGGCIKKLAFLEFVRDYKHPKTHHVPIRDIEKEWEEKHGSIYNDNI